jgi:hypothetical protein
LEIVEIIVLNNKKLALKDSKEISSKIMNYCVKRPYSPALIKPSDFG